MGLVAIDREAALLGKARVAIDQSIRRLSNRKKRIHGGFRRALDGLDGRLYHRRTGRMDFDQRGVDHRSFLDQETLAAELAVQFGHQRLGAPALGQARAEAAEGGLVRRHLVERKAAEMAERNAVGHRLFKPGVGQLVPLRQQQRLQHGERRIGRAAGPAAGHGTRQQGFQRSPVDQRADPRQPPVLPSLVRQKRIGETKLLCHHQIPPLTQLNQTRAAKAISQRSPPGRREGNAYPLWEKVARAAG